MRIWIHRWMVVVTLAAVCGGSPMSRASEPRVELPATVGAWTADGAPRRIDETTIFDYMNGAGELYLAYRFDHLDVRRYTSAELGEIHVELYSMEDADDAFGLMSEDWTGEPWALGALTVQSRRALYGAGLLRLACGTRYARVLSFEDTPGARAAIETLGRAIAADCPAPPAPGIVTGLPTSVPVGETPLVLQPQRTRFLRSYLVLNSAFYLSPDDVIGLDRAEAAVYAEYRPAAGDHTSRARAVLVRYVDAAAAERGLQSFHRGYLGDAPVADTPPPKEGQRGVGERWTAFALSGATLALVLDARTPAVADALLQALTGADEATEEPR
ncbi:MAG: hypothetical protein QGH45_17290 [Myxococcota bacterium]|jgi:hypothetical protein|nr:hypothetical protein [Myxococcota bacterium]